MAQADAVADDLWAVVRALPDEIRERFLEKLLADATIREEIEELLDLATVEERRQEPGRPLPGVFS